MKLLKPSAKSVCSEQRRNMRLYEKLRKPFPVAVLVLGLAFVNPFNIPPTPPAQADEIVVYSDEVKEPTKPRFIERTPESAKQYAENLLDAWGWNTASQWQCLELLWTKESNWRPNAFNKQAVYQNGEKVHAGGIPQILGLDPSISVEKQIQRGFEYILSRYGSPCSAWRFWQSRFWY